MPSRLSARPWRRAVTGEDARSFLDGLVTSDMDKVAVDRARYAALLTPQGKILFDFIVAEADGEQGGGFYLDAPRALAADLAKRLGFYKLRAKVSDRGHLGRRWASSPSGRRRPRDGGERHRLCRPPPPRARRPRIIASRDGLRGAGTGARRELSRPPHRARRARGRQGLRLRRRLPARGGHGPARRRRFRQGLLCRPGGRVAHGASRHRAHAHRAHRASATAFAARGGSR